MDILNKKVILLILDGWGIGKPDKFNAIDNAKTPNVDRLIREYPNVQLRADGGYVGLPEGQFGTSEINHQVIGTGQVVMQDLPRIDKSIEDGTFFSNKALINACDYVNKNNSVLHICGITSDGKVHSSLNHALSLIQLAKKQGVKKLYFHPFVDGRDAPPKSAQVYLDAIQKELDKSKFENASIATIQGRFFLDRDREWEKTDKAVELLLDGKGNKFTTIEAVINFNYNKNVTDEYFEQFILDEKGIIGKNDALIFFHYRTDRMYQIQKRILDRNIKGLKIVSFIEPFETDQIDVAFPRPEIAINLARTISEAGKTQFHITETEKYMHLTYFFNAGREVEYEGEVWERIQSNRFFKPFYNFVPSMMADDITISVLKTIKEDKTDFVVVNYSNTDMVGHTGNYEAAVIAAESVDFCVGKIYEAIKDQLDKYSLIVTADHGNSDIMWDYENDQPHTQHTTNPVPFILVSDQKITLDRRESLKDIAPTILHLMGIEKPQVMEGDTLINIKH